MLAVGDMVATNCDCISSIVYTCGLILRQQITTGQFEAHLKTQERA